MLTATNPGEYYIKHRREKASCFLYLLPLENATSNEERIHLI